MPMSEKRPRDQVLDLPKFLGQKRASGSEGAAGKAGGGEQKGRGAWQCMLASLLASRPSWALCRGRFPTCQGFLYLSPSPSHSSETLHPDCEDLALKIGAMWGRRQVGSGAPAPLAAGILAHSRLAWQFPQLAEAWCILAHPQQRTGWQLGRPPPGSPCLTSTVHAPRASCVA